VSVSFLWVIVRLRTTADIGDTMRYRHEQMLREREQRMEQRAIAQAIEAALWATLSADEQHLWQVFSGAVADVR
jgi:hypothetical protein